MGTFNRLIGIFGQGLSQMDLEFIDSYLDESGKFLFFQMSEIDQRHSVAVARHIAREAGYQQDLDFVSLIKAALLHDIGKVKGELNLVNRIVAGAIRRICPAWLKMFSNQTRTGWLKIRYGFYVDLVHPARGSCMARILGIEERVVELIRHHHDPPQKGQNAELTWLQLADNRH